MKVSINSGKSVKKMGDLLSQLSREFGECKTGVQAVCDLWDGNLYNMGELH